MSTVEFGLMLQPFPLHFAGIELYEYNRRLIRSLSPGFTTLWVEDHLQLGEIATLECKNGCQSPVAIWGKVHSGVGGWLEGRRVPCLWVSFSRHENASGRIRRSCYHYEGHVDIKSVYL